MKGILEFTLPEERDEHLFAINGLKWALCMWDLDQFLRNACKYEEITKEKRQVYEEMRDKIRDILEEHNLSLEMIT